MSKNEYNGLIFTNHALERMRERGITQEKMWQTYKNPDTQNERKHNTTERRKKFGNSEISIIFTHNERNEAIVVSCWVEPPLPGSKDAKEKEWWNRYKKAGFWGKIYLTLIKQLGA